MSSDQPFLHDSWQSSACYRVRIALELKGIAYEAARYDIIGEKHRTPDFLRLNPQGTVPVMEVDGCAITQSLAIIEYLDETWPDRRLLPDEPAGRARVRALSYVVAMETHVVTNMKVARDAARRAGGADIDLEDWLVTYFRRGFDALDRMLDHPATGIYCHGDSPSMADCCLVPQAMNVARAGLDLSNWPNISRIVSTCRANPSIDAAHPRHFTP